MTKADLLAALTCRPVPFEGGGLSCFLRPLTTADVLAVQAYRKEHGEGSGHQLIFVRAVCDEHGTRLFADEDAAAVAGWNGAAVNAAMKRLGEMEGAEGDGPKAPGASSTPTPS